MPVAPVPTTSESSGYGITDTSLDEGPAFDGKSYGLAKGTANTYVIPGMEEMSPEEYRSKLQESISARQAKRREDSLKSSNGKIGNANSQSYLDGLSNKGETIVSAVDVFLSSSSSSSVLAANEDLMNERRVADQITLKTEEEIKYNDDVTSDEKDIDEIAVDNEVSHDEGDSKDENFRAVEEERSKDEKQKISRSDETLSGLKAVVTKMEKSKAEKDQIRLSEWQVSPSFDSVGGKSEVDNAVEKETERYSLGQTSGYFIRNDDTPRKNPILGDDPSKKYVTVQDRTGSTTQRTASVRVETQFDRNSVGAIRKSPLKSQAAAQSLAKSEMDQIQRPTRGSESPSYDTVSGRTTIGDLRKNKPLSSAPSAVSLVESEQRLRPSPGTELPKYHKIEDRRSVGDLRKPSASNNTVSNPSISSLVGSEKRQRPTPKTQSSTQSTSDVNTFAGDLRKSSNKPLPASLARTSLAREERRTRPTPSSSLPPHAQIQDMRSVGDFRDPTHKKSQSSTTSLVESEVRQRPTPAAISKDVGLSDSRGVVFKTKALDFAVNEGASLIADEVRQRPTASAVSKNEKGVTDSRGVIFKASVSKSQAQSASSLISNEVRQRRIASQTSNDPTLKKSQSSTTSLVESEVRQRPTPAAISKDVGLSDSRGVVFKTKALDFAVNEGASLIADEVRQRPTASAVSKNEKGVTDSRGVIFKASVSKSQAQSASSLISNEVRQRRIASQTSKDHDASDSRGIVFKSSPSKHKSQASPSLIADEVRQRPVASHAVKDTSATSDSRGIIFKTTSSYSTSPSATSLIDNEQTQRKSASTSDRKFAPVQDRTGDARVTAKKSIPPPSPPKPFVVKKQTRSPRRASTDPRKYTRVENRVGPDVRRPPKESSVTSRGEDSHWWNEKTQRPRTVPSKQPEALQRDTQTQSSQVRMSHMKEEKRRREKEMLQAPIAELQPSSLKALVKEERHEEEEKHAKPPPLKMLLNSDRPIAGVKEDSQKSTAKESHLQSLLKEEEKGALHEKRQKRPLNAGDEWWNERNDRPKGYVKHSQSMNTSYENRDSHLRDYGDVVSQPGSDSSDGEDFSNEDIP